MHPHLFRHFLDHHGLQVIRPVIQEVRLAPQDGLAHAQNRVLALLDVFHQLNGRRESLFHVIADVAVGGIAHQQAAVGGIQPELRQVIIVHEDLPLAVHFAELHIGFHQPRLSLVVAQARLGIEPLDHVHGALHELHGTVQRPRHFLELVVLQQLQVFRDDLLRQGVLRINHLQLEQEALLQIPRRYARRVEFLHHGQRFFHVFHGIVAGCGDFFERRRQVSVFVQVADDRLRDSQHCLVADAHAELPAQVVRKSLRRGKELIKGRLLDILAFAPRGA